MNAQVACHLLPEGGISKLSSISSLIYCVHFHRYAVGKDTKFRIKNLSKASLTEIVLIHLRNWRKQSETIPIYFQELMLIQR